MRLIIFICLLSLAASCDRYIPSKRMIEDFKRGWLQEYQGYGFQSRGENVFLFYKIGCDHLYYFKYDTVSKTFDYTVNKFHSNDCKVDVDDPGKIAFFKFYLSLDVKSLDARLNRYGVVELLLPYESCVYYIKDDDKLPLEAKDWLKTNAILLESNFYYIDADERPTCRTLIYD